MLLLVHIPPGVNVTPESGGPGFKPAPHEGQNASLSGASHKQ
jgi:hypothetical protein